MSRDTFNRFHLKDSRVGNIPFLAQQPKKLELTLGKAYKHFKGRLTVTFGMDGVNGYWPSQEGILALIKKLYIEQNGDGQLWKTSGKQILIQHIDYFARNPRGLTPAPLDGDGTLTVDFIWYFGHPKLANDASYGLDLRKEQGRPGALSNAHVVCEWGSVADLFRSANGVTIESAELSLRGVEMIIPSLTQAAKDAGIAYPRAGELTYKMMSQTVTAEGEVEFELTRQENSRLVSICILQQFRKGINEFRRDDDYLTLEHDTYKFVETSIGHLKYQQNIARVNDISENLITIYPMDPADILSALHDRELKEELMLTVPVNAYAAGSTFDEAGNHHECHVLLTYAMDAPGLL